VNENYAFAFGPVTYMHYWMLRLHSLIDSIILIHWILLIQ